MSLILPAADNPKSQLAKSMRPSSPKAASPDSADGRYADEVREFLNCLSLLTDFSSVRLSDFNSLDIICPRREKGTANKAASRLLWKKRKAYSLGIPKNNWLME